MKKIVAGYAVILTLLFIIFSVSFFALGEVSSINAQLNDYQKSIGKIHSLILTISVLGCISFILAAFMLFYNKKSYSNVVKTSLENLNNISMKFASSAAEIASANQQIAIANAEQYSNIERISSSVTETNAMIEQNNETTKNALVVAEKTNEFAKKEKIEMTEMAEAMNEIRSSSSEIAKIIKVIDEIAFQTNILALNAAVEAARAGEAGAGFSIVAEEVRNLAKRSAQAAHDTEDIINKNIEMSRKGYSIVNKVLSSLDDITINAKALNDYMSEISVASNEQSQGVALITKSIDQMDSILEKNAMFSKESASASQMMMLLADNLVDIVDDLSGVIYGNSMVKKSHQIHSENNELDLNPMDISYKEKQIEWDESFSVHVKEMDDHHKRLFEIINNIFFAIKHKKSNKDVKEILLELVDYTKYHFSKEELLMQKAEYPQLEQQITAHTKFIEKVSELMKNIDSSALSSSIGLDAAMFLSDWLQKHIKGMDTKYSRYMNQKEIR